MAREDYDFIVVGGGSAGSVAAARLARDGGYTVLLLEGGYSHHHPLLDMPPGIFKMINGSKFMHYHTTEPQPHLGGRAHDIPQANVLGGGSSVNAQVYMRGRPSDYEEWNALLRGANDGADWSWPAVLRHFRRMEDNNRLNDAFHGTDGPMHVSDPGHIDDLSRWFVQAVQGLGEPFNPDFNGGSQRGRRLLPVHEPARPAVERGLRLSRADEERSAPRHPPALARRADSGGSRPRAGVAWRDQSGARREAFARSEIIVAAGALITPKLLMLSGIGPADQLSQHGIPVVCDSPGVGSNLIDHPEVPIIANVNGPYGYYRQGEGWRMLRNGLHFKLFGTGPITSAGVEAGAFVNPGARDAEPTIQAFCVPIVYLDRDTRTLVRDAHGLTVTTVVVKPKSRGWVRLRSADPAAPPLVSPNLLKEEADMAEMIAGQRFFLRAFQTQPLARRVERIAIPDPAKSSDDEAMRSHCRRFVKTNYHPAGTARMGGDGDRMAPLDPRLRVRGVEGLRVCDMSAVPNINAGNTNAAAMMLGDRCADFILGAA